MLVYRDFAIQDDQRTYLPGPALSAPQVVGRPLQLLRRLVQPQMETLCERVQETVDLSVRVGTQTRFLASVESTQLLHVGNRQGTILPAHKTSGGKALLAELDDEQLEGLYRHDPAGDEVWLSGPARTELLRELRSIRQRGYSVNLQGTETGVSAIGKALRHGSGEAVAALSVAMPSARFDPQQTPALVAELGEVVSRAETEMRAQP